MTIALRILVYSSVFLAGVFIALVMDHNGVRDPFAFFDLGIITMAVNAIIYSEWK